MQEGPTPTRYIPVTEWTKYHAWPPLGGLRHLIFNAKENGFIDCIRKIGNRVLIDEQRFFKWVDTHGEIGHGK